MLRSADRYFSSNLYNMVRVIERMAELIEAKGGEVERHDEELRIHTTGFDEKITRLIDRIDRIAEHILMNPSETEKNATRESIVHSLRSDLQELEQKKRLSPVISTRFVSLTADLWLRFKLDGYEYYFEVESNPFFPDRFTKATYGEHGVVYLEEIEAPEKIYYPNDMFNPVASVDTVADAAKDLLEYLERKRATI